ncbi:hypothetical protein CEP52_013274 [Fusarium oligoseptatum]|uniref:Uncharacterized protein n=1 Tax=Fusarium oligoseptatum TaxID=2604345 RepID=A0A428SUL4_9HYPO|nr:hypothetical protein CEP52_013274 [Fusarium oligoseptatum]
MRQAVPVDMDEIEDDPLTDGLAVTPPKNSAVSSLEMADGPYSQRGFSDPWGRALIAGATFGPTRSI